MPQSLHTIPIHFIWSTKNRLPLIKPEIEIELYKYMASMFRIDNIEQLFYFAPLGLEYENRILIQGRCPCLLYFTPLG